MSEVADVALATRYTVTYAGHHHGEVDTVPKLEAVLDEAAVLAGPSGERSTVEIGPADSEVVVLEFALFADCAYLRHGDTVAVEPRFLDQHGQIRADLERPRSRSVHNPLDEVEELPWQHLLCTPAWVCGVVHEYAETGAVPDNAPWRPAIGHQ